MTTEASTATSYPLYDCHGNNICSISKSGGRYQLSAVKTYDFWCGLRTGTGQKQSYWANLGHVTDHESGFCYRRSRYYEPGTGRFLSEDGHRFGGNRFTYANNNPVADVDRTGNSAEGDLTGFLGNILVAFGILLQGNAALTGQGIASHASDKAADACAKSVGSKLAKGLLPMLKLIKSLLDFDKDLDNLAVCGTAQLAKRYAGYDRLLLGQMLLTNAEFLGTSDDSWWGCKF